jgi:hypothetical protein
MVNGCQSVLPAGMSNCGGITPTTVFSRPSRVTGFPTIPESAPYRRPPEPVAQHDERAARPARRPRRRTRAPGLGATPKVSKKRDVTTPVRTRTGSPVPERVAGQAAKADRESNDLARSCHRVKLTEETCCARCRARIALPEPRPRATGR